MASVPRSGRGGRKFESSHPDFFMYASLAQLVEQLIRNEQVVGSSPMRGSNMRYYTYILYSASIDKYYVGHTNNLERRIYEHNLGKEKFSSKGIPWEIKFSRTYNNNVDAAREERRLKKCKNRKYLENYMVALLAEHPDM